MMTQKSTYRDMEMDVLEMLYYERRDLRQKAYAAKQKKSTIKKATSTKKAQPKHDTDTFNKTLKQSIYNMC